VNRHQIDATHDPGGFRLRREGIDVVVSAVAWRCPASEAGVRVNDILVEIDGIKVAHIDNVTLSHLISRSDRATLFVFKRPTDGTIVRFVYDVRALRMKWRRRLGSQEQGTLKAQPAHMDAQAK
jgi:predicted metalloprotease with PDZ domain